MHHHLMLAVSAPPEAALSFAVSLHLRNTMPSNRFEEKKLNFKTSVVNSDHLLKHAKRTMQAERTQNVSAVARVTIR